MVHQLRYCECLLSPIVPMDRVERVVDKRHPLSSPGSAPLAIPTRSKKRTCNDSFPIAVGPPTTSNCSLLYRLLRTARLFRRTQRGGGRRRAHLRQGGEEPTRRA